MLKVIVCDWNRTLLSDEYEEGFFGGLCRRVFLRAVLSGDLRKAWSLLGLGRKCYRLLREARMDRKRTLFYVARITELLNGGAIGGLRADFLERYIRLYARSAARRLDARLLDPLRSLRQAGRVQVGIISSGCRSGIEQSLASAGYGADFIIANEFRLNAHTVAAFELTVMANKAALLEETLQGLGATWEQTMYVGDSEQDEECFERSAFPVVSFQTPEQDRRRFSDRYGAFAPRSGEEFRAYLETLVGR